MTSPKDYAQPRRKRQPTPAAKPRPAAKSRVKKRHKPWGLMLFSFIALAGLIFGLNQLMQVKLPETPQPDTTPSAPKPVVKPTPAKPAPQPAKPAPKSTAPTQVAVKPAPGDTRQPATAPTAPKTKAGKYEFYELLPNSEITPEAVEAYQSTPRTAKMDKTYLLQAGSFRSAADAEKMRASLILEGLPNVHTDKSNGSNGIWYRVRIGPFDNRSALNKAHDKLARLNINAMTVRVD